MVSTSGSCAVRSMRIVLPLLDDREAFARLEAELLLALVEHVLEQDQSAAHDERSRWRTRVPRRWPSGGCRRAGQSAAIAT